MARERKPLIVPGSLLSPRTPPSQELDLLGNIIQHDRDVSGRGRRIAAEPPEKITEVASVLPASQQADNTESQVSEQAGSQLPDKPEIQQAGNMLAIIEFFRHIEAAFERETRKITFSIPVALDEAIIEQLKDNWREGNQKKDILTRGALLALYELKTGQPLINFEAENPDP